MGYKICCNFFKNKMSCVGISLMPFPLKWERKIQSEIEPVWVNMRSQESTTTKDKSIFERLHRNDVMGGKRRNRKWIFHVAKTKKHSWSKTTYTVFVFLATTQRRSTPCYLILIFHATSQIIEWLKSNYRDTRNTVPAIFLVASLL